MNPRLIPVVSFTPTTHKTFPHNLRNRVSSNVNITIRGFATADGNSESEQVVQHMMNPTPRVKKTLSPNETSYASLIDSLCKQDRIDDAYRVLKEMFVSGISPSFYTLNNVLRGFLRIGDLRKAYDMHIEMIEYTDEWWMDPDMYSSLLQRLSNEVTYTSLMNAYLDEGKLDIAFELNYEMEHLDALLYDVPHISCLPNSVLNSVFINGLDHNKARTTEVMMELITLNYNYSLQIPTLDYRSTLVENCSDDEFKSLVELVQGFCSRGLENAYDTMLKFNYKPDGRIVYNLFIIEHCNCYNAVQAYNTYKEMAQYGFACHMFTMFALIKTLGWKNMVNELLWVIQNVLRSCDLNDSEILKFLDQFNPREHYKHALFDMLAEKAKDGLFLKCSYAPPSA